MNKALYLLAIPVLLLPLTAIGADPRDWYFGGSVVYTNDDPARRLDDFAGGGQISVGRYLSDVFASRVASAIRISMVGRTGPP